MEDNELIVTEEVTENTEEQPVEEVVEEKMYSEKELHQRMDELIPRKLKRREERIQKEYEKKYGKLESILKLGLEVNSIEEATEKLEGIYSQQGINIPKEIKSNLSERQERILAEADAQELIETSSINELKDEINGLVRKGYENMSSSEKIIFTKLNSYVKEKEDREELEKMGVNVDELNSNQEFKDFTSHLNSEMSMKDKYEFYKKNRPEPVVEQIGSMKGEKSNKDEIKDFYTAEEARSFSKADLDKNPKLYEAILKSMSKWD